MGVESKFFVIPNDSGYRPPSRKVCELIQALRVAGILCDPKSSRFAAEVHQLGSLSSLAEYEGFCWSAGRNRVVGSMNALEQFLAGHENSDARIEWPNRDLKVSGLKYPLTVIPGEEGVY